MHALTYMDTGHGSYSTIFMAVQRKGGVEGEGESEEKFIAPWEKGAERETSRNFNHVTFKLTLYKRKS